MEEARRNTVRQRPSNPGMLCAVAGSRLLCQGIATAVE